MSDQGIFLGVDLGGSQNTWAAGLWADGEVALCPRQMRLEELVALCHQREVLGVAVDAHLSASIADESGMRAPDQALRAALPPKARPWVGSFNSMMAIPVRGLMLSQALSPLVGTILETHPRASLWFSLGERHGGEVFAYKPRAGGARERAEAAVAALWSAWSARYGLSSAEAPRGDGALDALVCATVAKLYHQERGALWRPPGARLDATGRGPLYVTSPWASARP